MVRFGQVVTNSRLEASTVLEGHSEPEKAHKGIPKKWKVTCEVYRN